MFGWVLVLYVKILFFTQWTHLHILRRNWGGRSTPPFEGSVQLPKERVGGGMFLFGTLRDHM